VRHGGEYRPGHVQPREGLKLKILDPACGTGGFLRAGLLAIRDIIAEQEYRKWGKNREKAEVAITNRLRSTCDSNIFGIDKLPELVRAAQMNLAMHGDGSTNVFHANSLQPFGGWANEARERVRPGTFDVVFTNPPFGSRLPIDDPQILDQFQLSRFEAKSPRSSMPPEQIFVERCLDFLKPGGRMAIVLPEGI
jgi:type I restriction enzyme M protein